MCGVGAVVVLGLSSALSLEDLPGWELVSVVGLLCDLFLRPEPVGVGVEVWLAMYCVGMSWWVLWSCSSHGISSVMWSGAE